MADMIIVGIVICVIGSITYYLYRAKKRGDSCIGCPNSKQCGGKCSPHCKSNRE